MPHRAPKDISMVCQEQASTSDIILLQLRLRTASGMPLLEDQNYEGPRRQLAIIVASINHLRLK